MAALRPRSAALLISVHVDVESGGPWFARILSYRDALEAENVAENLDSVEKVTAYVRNWLWSVVRED